MYTTTIQQCYIHVNGMDELLYILAKWDNTYSWTGRNVAYSITTYTHVVLQIHLHMQYFKIARIPTTVYTHTSDVSI